MDVDTLLQLPAVTPAPVATSFIVHRKADPLAGQVLADGLRVSAPSDPLEREAEATASRVMRMQAPAKAGRAPAGELQRACASCDGKKDKAVHRKPASVQRAPAAIASQGGSGSALPEGVRGDMEGRFGGQDFSGVRVHAGPQANTLARSYNARAFTMGSDIYFGQGEYSPSSKGGQHLLAHELTHVVQGGGRMLRAPDQKAEVARSSIDITKFAAIIQREAQRFADDKLIFNSNDFAFHADFNDLSDIVQNGGLRHFELISDEWHGLRTVVSMNVDCRSGDHARVDLQANYVPLSLDEMAEYAGTCAKVGGSVGVIGGAGVGAWLAALPGAGTGGLVGGALMTLLSGATCWLGSFDFSVRVSILDMILGSGKTEFKRMTMPYPTLN